MSDRLEVETREAHMVNLAQLEQLHQGVASWNQWRDRHPEVSVDLSEADLSGLDLRQINLRSVDLTNANLSHANLSHADLSGAVLRQVDISHADLSHAQVLDTSLTWSDSRGTCFTQMRFTRLPKLSLHLETSLMARGAIALDPVES
ncbi:MAG TPA: pentapeptide repeat-containing protein [Candidatus Obscuribacterales bacterium]